MNFKLYDTPEQFMMIDPFLIKNKTFFIKN